MKPVLKAPGPMLLKLICDEPLSNFAFNFNLRHYDQEGEARKRHEELMGQLVHGRGLHPSTCQLNVSGF